MKNESQIDDVEKNIFLNIEKSKKGLFPFVFIFNPFVHCLHYYLLEFEIILKSPFFSTAEKVEKFIEKNRETFWVHFKRSIFENVIDLSIVISMLLQVTPEGDKNIFHENFEYLLWVQFFSENIGFNAYTEKLSW